MNTGQIFTIIAHSLVLLSLLEAAAVQRINVFSGTSGTFYCPRSSFINIKKCVCNSTWDCWLYHPKIKRERYLDEWKITVPYLQMHDSGCYKCGYQGQEFHLEVLPANAPSVVIGKTGGSVVLSCTLQYQDEHEMYWCREDQNGNCQRNESQGQFRIQDFQDIFSLEKVDLTPEDNGKYACMTSEIYTRIINLQVLQNKNGLSAPEIVNVMPGEQIKVACQYIQDYIDAKKSWHCSKQFTGQHCKTGFEVIDDRTRSELVLIHNVTMSDNDNVYTCEVARSEGNSINITVKLIVGLTTTRHVEGTTEGTTGDPIHYRATLGQSHLLYGIICLLAIIAVTLLMILLKLYCKRRKDGFSDRVQSPDLGGGTFYMSDLRTDLHLANPVPKEPYTACTDDSSSTSSESSGHSFGNISVGPHHQYLTIIPTPKDAYYENIPEEMPSALPDYENVTADKDQDYVNIPEPQNTSSTEDQDDEAGSPKGKWKKSTASCKSSSSSSSESSSSDESEEESVNYSLVVFKKATE
ncbi:hypothetical protein SRHO_G00270220 [Serrasalmus rhombeus]